MGKVLVVGDLVVDYYLDLPKGPITEEIKTKTIRNAQFGKNFFYGGCAPNVAISLKRSGIDTGILGCIGNDTIGEDYLRYLQSEGIDTKLVEQKKQTTKCFIFENGTVWDACAVTSDYKKEVKNIGLDKYSITCLTTSDPHIVDPIMSQAEGIICYSPGKYIEVCKTPRYSVQKAIDRANILVVNEQEKQFIEHLLSIDDLVERLGVQLSLLAVTKGHKGSTVYTTGEKIFIPGVHAKLLDDSGAGDAYTAGVISSFLRGLDLLAIGETASCAAAFVLEARGAHTNAKNWQAIQLRRRDIAYY